MNNNEYFHRVAEQSPTKFWINNATREEARKAIEAGAVGCTQNPSYIWKMLTHESESDYSTEILDRTLKESNDDNEVIIRLQRKLVNEIAQIFLPLWENSAGKLGYVSIQGDPFQEETDSIIEQARANRAGALPNIMCKVPATESGLRAISILVADGTPINATEVMSVHQAFEVCERWSEAARKLDSPPTCYYSHITGIYDEYIKGWASDHKIDISPDVLVQAGLAVARKCYKMTKSRWPGIGFIGGGVRGLHHFTEMVGSDACITINWVGTADQLINLNQPVIWRFYNPVADYVVDELLSKIEEFRRAFVMTAIGTQEYEMFGPVVLFRSSFEKAWESAREFVSKRRKATS